MPSKSKLEAMMRIQTKTNIKIFFHVRMAGHNSGWRLLVLSCSILCTFSSTWLCDDNGFLWWNDTFNAPTIIPIIVWTYASFPIFPAQLASKQALDPIVNKSCIIACCGNKFHKNVTNMMLSQCKARHNWFLASQIFSRHLF